MGWEIAVLAALVVGGVVMYNSLVKEREKAEGAWADIDVQLKRRYDLVPNLVETVKGYASHEQETLEAVITARNRAMAVHTPGEAGRAEGALTGALKSLFALAENYPELKAAPGFQDLQGRLSELEEAIQNSRRYYNAVVRDYNTKVQQVPTNVVARSFGFRQREFFQAEEGETGVPRVDFGGAS
jgi:LemA protein